jgi:hypothetical protein
MEAEPITSVSTTVAISVEIGAGTSVSTYEIEAINKIPNVVSAVVSEDDTSNIQVEVSHQDVAKAVAGKIARMFPGKPVRWSSSSASA